MRDKAKGRIEIGEENQFIHVLILLIENVPNGCIISFMRFQFGFKTKSGALMRL